MEGLHKRLVDAKVVLVVGNGGIALELVYSLVSKQACQVWRVSKAVEVHGSYRVRMIRAARDCLQHQLFFCFIARPHLLVFDHLHADLLHFSLFVFTWII